MITLFYRNFLKIRVDHELGLCEGLLERLYWGAMRVQPDLSIASFVRLAPDDVIPGLDGVY